MLDVDQGKSIVHKLFFLWSSVFLMIHRSTIWDFSAKFRSLDLQKMFLSNFVIRIFKQNICPFQWDSKTSSANITVFITSRPGTGKKTNPEKILVFGDHHPKASGIQHSVYIYIYIRTFIYLFIGLFIYWFIYIFIYLFIFIYVFNYSFILYVYIYTCIYIYISYIYINWHQPLVINWLYAHHALYFGASITNCSSLNH